MQIIKRNGKEEEFDISKIEVAITKANESVVESEKLDFDQITEIARDIRAKILSMDRSLNVEEIQDLVENGIMERQAFSVARNYITYRYERALLRKSNSTDNQILSLIECDNEEIKQENSNKNSTINSVQRDYMAGEVSKDITRRFLLDPDIIDAHEKGIIHFHDADYFAQHMHNCFHSKTEFITDRGVIRFKDCRDGQIVNVKDLYGNWRTATVRKYERQKMQKVTFRCGRTIKTVRCTYDHRWVLLDGSVTTNLSVGDKLTHLLDSSNLNYIYNPYMFCIGMILGDGTDIYKEYKNHIYGGVKIRLCGEKTRFINTFLYCGYYVSKRYENGDVELVLNGFPFKKMFIENHIWRFFHSTDLIDLFNGYYCADGSVDRNEISTSNDHLAQMIRDISAVAGYHITSENFQIRNTPFKQDAQLYTFRFMKYQLINRNWKVINIDRSDTRLYDAWCVEEPITHTFTLNNGMVTGNCCLVNLEDMLQNGTVISGTMIEKPHSFSTACNIATQIIAQVASSQYGGQSISLSHLAPFVDISRQKFRKEVKEEFGSINKEVTEEEINQIAEKRVLQDINKGVQIIQYQVVTLMTTNGQAPFITVFMYLNEVEEGRLRDDLALIISEVLRQRILGVKNEAGAYITPAFPKLIYVLEENNITEGSKYWDITKLAAECTAKRMVPDYISEKIMFELKEGNCYPCMGCRSFLNVYREPWTGDYKFYGRFNQGVVTLNLVDVACSSGKDMDKFWEILDERLELCRKALMARHERLLDTPSDVAPILWQYGAIARLEKGEPINKLLFNGYSSISLGYAGLYECTYYMTGNSHTHPDSIPFALEVMQKLNDACEKWKEETTIGFSVYGTPLESTTYKFARCLQNRFGIIEGVTDKNYITNSYHVHVTEKIDAFKKLKFESPFQELSPGGWTNNIASNSHPKLRERIQKRCSIFNRANGEEELFFNTVPSLKYPDFEEGVQTSGDECSRVEWILVPFLSAKPRARQINVIAMEEIVGRRMIYV